MIPYADFLSFELLLYPILAGLLLWLVDRRVSRSVAIVTIGMLAVLYAGTVHILPHADSRAIWVVAAFALYEWALGAAFLQVRGRVGKRRLPHYVVLALALLPLACTKFLPFLRPGFSAGFLGISYVTFRAVDVVFCIQDRLITSLPLAQYVTFLFFFPTISSGPIDRYRRFEKDWKSRRDRAQFLEDLDGAVQRIFHGFLLKFILAALVERYWMDPVAARTGLPATLSYMYAYSFYLFFDFAGYSAFAIGVGYLFGIHTPENFIRPFLARSIADFWNRWHVTLSWWLRDHVFMRFTLAATKGRWFRGRHTASRLGFLLTMGLMGLWHGPEPRYLLYGLYHGGLLVGQDALGQWNRKRHLWGDSLRWRVAGTVLTLQLVCFGFLIFSGRIIR